LTGAFVLAGARPASAQIPAPAASAVQIEADQQRRDGNKFLADGNVVVHYQNKVLKADHAQYDTQTYDVQVTGNVQFDSDMQHIQAEHGTYNVKQGTGTFSTTHGTVTPPKERANPMLLLSPNPVYFEAKEVRRLDDETYQLYSVWLTVCAPKQPTWKFYSAEATLRVDDRVAMINSNFRILRVPLFYTPYASVPVGHKVRQSGFTIPDLSNSNIKGTVVGDSFYWAPLDWLDAEVGAELYSKRGWAQYFDFRARPWDGARITYSYNGVQDRGLPGPTGRGPSQSGHQSRFFGETTFGHGWRLVADINELSSLTFRLAFSTSYAAATYSEVISAGFLTNNFGAYSFNVAAEQYRDFLSTTPGNVVQLRKTPEVRFSSVEQQPWKNWPFYFSFDSFTGGNHRDDPLLTTPAMVERSELAPRITVPLHLGSWLGVTTSATGRATHYGEELQQGALTGQNFVRTTGEFTTEIQTPAIERIWGSDNEPDATRWKHSIEPEITYHYVTGVNDFLRIPRFDQNDTLVDTNQVEYGIIQRLFRKKGTASAEQFAYWRIAQDHYFDPTFGGAILPGQTNILAPFTALTAFSFANGERRWSPIVSDLRITPGGVYDFGLVANFDPVTRRQSAVGLTSNLRPYHQLFVSFSDFDSRNTLQPRFNQLGVRGGWGQMNRRGFNAVYSVNYDLYQRYLLQQAFQVSYNGSCCGISFEYRRLALGPVQSDNQFRIALLIANFGSFGTMRRQERLF
jgi:LPS-assembly protein